MEGRSAKIKSTMKHKSSIKFPSEFQVEIELLSTYRCSYSLKKILKVHKFTETCIRISVYSVAHPRGLRGLSSLLGFKCHRKGWIKTVFGGEIHDSAVRLANFWCATELIPRQFFLIILKLLDFVKD